MRATWNWTITWTTQIPMTKDKAFHAKTWGAEDKGNLDWARPDNQLVKEGEEQ